MAQVRLDLLAIVAGATYTNTIRAVTRDLIKSDVYPQIIMVEETETQTDGASNHEVFKDAKLTTIVQFQPTPGTDISTALNSLYRDIWIAMAGASTRTHGGNCIQTVFNSYDPVTVAPEVGVSGAVINWHFQLYHTWDAP